MFHFGALFMHTSSAVAAHHPCCECAAWSEPESIWAFGATYNGMKHLLRKSVNLTFSVSRGAGGFSIAPTLTASVTVDRSAAPAFMLMDHLFSGMIRFWFIDDHALDYLGMMSSVVPRLRTLFSRRLASPKDVNQLGQCLMHSAHLFVSLL